MYLPWWAEGPAVGLFAVMLKMPYDIIGVKLIWWTWHDNDFNIKDKTYLVPWNNYNFYAAFVCSFVWLVNLTRKIFVNEIYNWKKLICYFL